MDSPFRFSAMVDSLAGSLSRINMLSSKKATNALPSVNCTRLASAVPSAFLWVTAFGSFGHYDIFCQFAQSRVRPKNPPKLTWHICFRTVSVERLVSLDFFTRLFRQNSTKKAAAQLQKCEHDL